MATDGPGQPLLLSGHGRGPTRVLVVSLAVPFPGIPHAGGLYLWNHLQVLVDFAHVTLLAPDIEANRAAVERVPEGVDVVLGHVPRFFSSTVGTFARKAINYFTLAYPPVQYWRGLSLAMDRLVGDFDVVEIHWAELAQLAFRVRRSAPNTPVIAVLYDVQSQRLERDRVASRSMLARLRSLLVSGQVRKFERRVATAIDRVVVFSGKDGHLLERLGVPGATVLRPPLAREAEKGRRRDAQAAKERIVLLVAAFDRSPNVEGAEWFLSQVWPSVARRVPDAHVALVGGGIPSHLKDLARRGERVHVVGYVEDLRPVYDQAAVAVVPLFTGAGLKFKLAEAALAGVPVVSTSVGAEGYGELVSLLSGVTDEPWEFANQITRILGNPSRAREGAHAAQEAAQTMFGFDGYSRALRALYADVLITRRPTTGGT